MINKMDSTPLMINSRDGNVAAVENLLASSVDVNQQNINGDTALMLGIVNFRDENAIIIIKMLLKHGANVYLENLGGFTALDLAYQTARDDIISTIENNMARTGRIEKKLWAQQTRLPDHVANVISSYLFQDLQSLTVSQLQRVYQKVYGKKCPAKTKREILKMLHRK